MEDNIRGVVCKLYPNNINTTKLYQTTGCCRYVWNYFLNRRLRRYKKGLPTSYSIDSKFLTKLKRRKTWLGDVSAVALQQVLKDLDTAFKNFYRRIKNGEKPGFPKFKSKHKSRNSFRIVNRADAQRLKDIILNIPRVGLTKLRKSRTFNIKNVKSYTIFEDCGKWFISFVEYFKPKKLKKTNNKVGIDLGVKKFVYPSKGKPTKPLNTKELDSKIITKQRELSRKQKGSNRWQKCKQQLKILHQKLRYKRNDFNHKISTYYVENQDVIIVEDLKIKNMTKNCKGTLENPGKNVKAKSGLNRSILSQSWGSFTEMLRYKCEWYGKKLIKVNPAYTSQICSFCGFKSKYSRRSQSKFKCIKCKRVRHADRNAAINILNRGLALA
jgi:putative transposase